MTITTHIPAYGANGKRRMADVSGWLNAPFASAIRAA